MSGDKPLAFVAFTDRGAALACRLAAALGGEVTCSREKPDFSLADWTAAAFASNRALVFVGAAGIAVRAVAPHLKSKATDPAVVALDEDGQFVIPLVSGHLGGANELARRIAAVCGGQAVLSTATDRRGIFAVDLWAVRQGLTVAQPGRIKQASAALLDGKEIAVFSRWPVAGDPPPGVRLTADRGEADVLVDYRPCNGKALHLIPRCLTLGVGCRRGITPEQLERAFARFCDETGLIPEAVCAAASIDRKADEAGLLRFCEARGWPVTFYTADQLAAVEGDFAASAFVRQTVGVANVCERASVRASGGCLCESKWTADGVALALAAADPHLDWSW